MDTRSLGKTRWTVPVVCTGTSALGSFPAQYGYSVDEDTAVSAIRESVRSGFTFIDTSNEYGGGDSERRIGAALAHGEGVPDDVLIATKVDPLPGSSDFSGSRVHASVEESRARLGMSTLPLVYLHDPEKIGFEASMAPGGPVEALVQLRDAGVIEALGVAGGPIDMELDFLRTGFFDVVLSHNRYTLIDSSAEPLISECAVRGVGFVNAAPFGGGMLVKGPSEVPRYCYSPVSEAVLERAIAIESICTDYGVPLAAVALQFSTRDERVASTVVGMSRPQRFAQVADLVDLPIPQQLWRDLEDLVALGQSGVGTTA
jgi:D-threo-aldose 1-dehydrogenase